MSGIGYLQLSTIIPFLFILFLGYICGKNKIISSDSVKTIGFVVSNYFTPFLVIFLLQTEKNEKNSSEIIWAFLASIIVFLLYYLVAYIFFLKKKKDTSNIHACALCSSAISIFAYPLLNNIPDCNACIYTAIFIFSNRIMFNIFSKAVLNGSKKKNIIKRIFSIGTLLELVGIILYFTNIRLPLPIFNTVEYVADLVPALSALLIGLFFSTFPVSGVKLQLDIIIVSVFKIFLFPMLVFGICLIAHFSIEDTLMYVTLSGLPCCIDLPTITAFSQNKEIGCSANVTAFSFVLSIISIPTLYFVVNQIYSMVF